MTQSRLLPSPRSREVELVIGKDCEILGWRPGGVGGASDTREWYDFLWKHRNRIFGLAHTHPDLDGTGTAHPSSIDLTSWQSLEIGFGTKWLYYVVTQSDICVVRLTALVPKIEYTTQRMYQGPWWIGMIRDLSYRR